MNILTGLIYLNIYIKYIMMKEWLFKHSFFFKYLILKIILVELTNGASESLYIMIRMIIF